MSDMKADGVCDCCACCVLSSIFCDKRTGDGSPRPYTLTRSRVVPDGRSCASYEAWLADERFRFLQTNSCLHAYTQTSKPDRVQHGARSWNLARRSQH